MSPIYFVGSEAELQGCEDVAGTDGKNAVGLRERSKGCVTVIMPVKKIAGAQRKTQTGTHLPCGRRVKKNHVCVAARTVAETGEIMFGSYDEVQLVKRHLGERQSLIDRCRA